MRNTVRRSSHAPDLGGKPISLAREPGDGRCEVELAARGHAHLSPYGLSFDRGFVLPDFEDSIQASLVGLPDAARVQMAQDVQRMCAALPHPGSLEYWEARRDAAREQAGQVSRSQERETKRSSDHRRADAHRRARSIAPRNWRGRWLVFYAARREAQWAGRGRAAGVPMPYLNLKLD